MPPARRTQKLGIGHPVGAEANLDVRLAFMALFEGNGILAELVRLVNSNFRFLFIRPDPTETAHP